VTWSRLLKSRSNKIWLSVFVYLDELLSWKLSLAFNRNQVQKSLISLPWRCYLTRLISWVTKIFFYIIFIFSLTSISYKNVTRRHLVSTIKCYRNFQFFVCFFFFPIKREVFMWRKSLQNSAALEEEKKHLEFMNSLKKYDSDIVDQESGTISQVLILFHQL
jgi:hypothetical protein